MTDLTFADFGLAQPIAEALARAKFEKPTAIQAQAIKPQLEGRDILGLAQTGTGKTAAFALPILHHILAMPGRAAPGTARALILAPTRELAVQILDEFRRFAGGARVSTCLVLGGVSRNVQIRNLGRGVDVLVATPGRLLDLVDDRKVRLDEVRFVVLDEADRMLDMGFVQPVRRIVSMLHPRRQSAMFSATMPSEVSGLAGSFLNNPVRVEVAPQSTVVTKIEQTAELLDGTAKRARLAELMGGTGVERAIVFARTKRGADRVAQNLEKDGIKAEAIHGNKAQNARQRALNNFRHGTVKVLVATDIAARGIDVPGITHVINYDLPDEPENYVHRIGRTARNGADGIAITLCAPDEVKKMRAVEKITGERLLAGGIPDGESKPRGNRRGGGGGKPGGGAAKQGRPNRRRRGPSRANAA
ncbi:ATP-dependent RNA helicase RhlE [Monaibacterium marinum]|uniref:ATP-dependent RNA helicase RhlE n=1 Tax=Pontivivens marinum TaxID=1690039 RepID=A0A2C9CLB1_9RHOB|nr:DEAD/DEAH box helicase [Monaibacterium marinum]SOH92301.1 ATP-dependent RNA helicase RhlE [Monaibacterium marinum]